MTDNDKIAKELDELERMAFELDHDIRLNSISEDKNEKYQNRLNAIAKQITGENSIGEASYIAYEVQALLHWALGDEDKAYIFVQDAISFKGDDILFTQTANNIYRQSTTSKGGKFSGEEQEWRGRDYFMILLVSIFWLISVLILITTPNMSRKRKGEIILYGSLLLFGWVILFSLVGAFSG